MVIGFTGVLSSLIKGTVGGIVGCDDQVGVTSEVSSILTGTVGGVVVGCGLALGTVPNDKGVVTIGTEVVPICTGGCGPGTNIGTK